MFYYFYYDGSYTHDTPIPYKIETLLGQSNSLYLHLTLSPLLITQVISVQSSLFVPDYISCKPPACVARTHTVTCGSRQLGKGSKFVVWEMEK